MTRTFKTIREKMLQIRRKKSMKAPRSHPQIGSSVCPDQPVLPDQSWTLAIEFRKKFYRVYKLSVADLKGYLKQILFRDEVDLGKFFSETKKISRSYILYDLILKLNTSCICLVKIGSLPPSNLNNHCISVIPDSIHGCAVIK